MAATVKYDDPTLSTLAASTKLPTDSRNEAQLKGRFATTSGTVAFDSSYPTGGYGPMNKFGLSSFARVFFMHPPGYLVTYNVTTDKVQVYDQGAAAGALAEVASGTNLSAVQAAAFEAKGLW